MISTGGWTDLLKTLTLLADCGLARSDGILVTQIVGRRDGRDEQKTGECYEHLHDPCTKQKAVVETNSRLSKQSAAPTWYLASVITNNV